MKPDKIFQFFNSQFPFNKEGLEEFVCSFETKSYKKGDIILENGSFENELRFLDNGIIREFYTTIDKEKNINFYTETGFITDFSSFIQEIKTKKNQECLTDVKVRILKREHFLKFVEKYSCGKLFIETIFKHLVISKESDEFNQFINTAEELYFDIMKSKPDWLIQIPQYHIASYLGITPETLSRIRKRIS
jgi:CRP-like cAMP-binding protein